jgi:hypothetical protein
MSLLPPKFEDHRFAISKACDSSIVIQLFCKHIHSLVFLFKSYNSFGTGLCVSENPTQLGAKCWTSPEAVSENPTQLGAKCWLDLTRSHQKASGDCVNRPRISSPSELQLPQQKSKLRLRPVSIMCAIVSYVGTVQDMSCY